MLAAVAVIGVVTQVPLALALESSLHSSNGNLFTSIFTIGVPEEIVKATSRRYARGLVRMARAWIPQQTQEPALAVETVVQGPQ
jgi:RsiW-degrading membrane proteinase PrsW (M82 family)